MDDHKPAEARTAGHEQGIWHLAALSFTLLFVLTAVCVSTGLVVYTAYNHELVNGFFAVLFGVLSCKAALLWVAWRH